MKTKFTHAELKKTQSFCYDQIGPDLGPYELLPDTRGIPEGGNMSGGIKFGSGEIVEMESWGITESPLDNLTTEQLEEVYNRLIHLQGVESMKEQGIDDPETVMGEAFWALDEDSEGRFWTMENRIMVAEDGDGNKIRSKPPTDEEILENVKKLTE